GREALSEAEARELLAAYALPMEGVCGVATEAEAVAEADALGYPVLLELATDRMSREDGEGIRLKARDAGGLRRAVEALGLLARRSFGPDAVTRLTVQPLVPPGTGEVAVSSTADAELGPVIRLGESGSPEGTPRHAVMALAPLTPLTAREMIEQASVLAAVRTRGDGKGSYLEGLEKCLLRLSRLVVEQPWIKEVRVSRLHVRDGRVLPRGVRVILHDPHTEEGRLPQPFAQGVG